MKSSQLRIARLISILGVIRAAAIHWILPHGTAVENFPAWEERWGTAIPGMSEGELDKFFGEMQESHRDVMGDVPHVCEFII